MFFYEIGALADILYIFHTIAIELFTQVIDDRNQSVIVGRLKNSIVECFIFVGNIENISFFYGMNEVFVCLT